MTWGSGPGRLKTHFESGENTLQEAKQPLPPVILAFIFILGFVAIVFGTSSLSSGDLVLGIAIYVTAIVLSLLLFVISRKTSRLRPIP